MKEAILAKKNKEKPTRKFIQLSEGEIAYAMSRAVVQGDWCFVSGTVGYLSLIHI